MRKERFTQGEWQVCNTGDIYTELGATNSAALAKADGEV